MKKALTIFLGLTIIAAASAFAGDLPVTQVSKILEYKGSLDLTDSQVKKLEIINKTAVARMVEAQGQANIRLKEIQEFTAKWTNMNGVAVRQLIKEYYKFMAEYKEAEVDAILQARSILKPEQLGKYQQLASIDALMISMEQNLAFK